MSGPAPVQMSPWPWRLDEEQAVITDARGRLVCYLGFADEADARARANGRAIIAALAQQRGG